MFDSLRHWFDSLEESSKLFDHAESEALHSALASVLYHTVSVNKQVTEREKQMFAAMLRQECGLNDEQIQHLYETARQSTRDWREDLHTINHFLKNRPLVRMNFMQKLMRIIDIDGVQDGELAVFYETLQEIFPDIRQT